MKQLLILVIVCFILFKNDLFAQKETNVWTFSNHNGLNFNNIITYPAFDSSASASQIYSSSICDKTTGDLLFYSDGQLIFNNNHLIIDSVLALGSGSVAQISNIIIPQPGNDSLYYLFTASRRYFCGVSYSVINMNLNGGSGGVQPGQHSLLLDSGYTNNHCLAAIRHSNGCDVWLVAHEWQTDAFRVYLITASGISAPVISHAGSVYSTLIALACYKFSPDGKKLACIAGNNGINVEVFDFDRSTGIVSPNPMSFALGISNASQGISFSPDNSKLYLCCGQGLIYQYDMNAGSYPDILLSQTLITAGVNDARNLQIGADKKIYVIPLGNYISVINIPNDSGLACNYTDSIMMMPHDTHNGCGVNFIESYFYDPPVNITNDSLGCSGNILNFAVDTVENATNYIWNMGDSTNVTGQSIIHTYTATGTYTVTLTILFNCRAPLVVTLTVVINCTGINETTNQNNIVSAYPNPTKGKFVLNTATKTKGDVFIYDVMGKEVLNKKNILLNHYEMDVSSFEKGIYFLKVKTGGNYRVQKIVKM